MRIISGEFKGRKLQRPPDSITRPTTDRVRESVFNILLHLEGFEFDRAVALDLFAGSGAMGLEALSRGAAHVTFVDKNPIARQVILDNVHHLKIQEKAYICAQDALELSPAVRPADLVFIDPPYSHDLEAKVLEQLVVKGWVRSGAIIVLETSKKTKLDFSQTPFFLLTARTFSNTTVSILKVD
ncbi:16S rRNA (guanine(966)-N(2))-methyltransferase RsmD [Candidatus Paracaedibacter symbiosus]|uniref:16S rRNA (guanine(966)-N(2))-methyltransferase RsmD n=1 Tax=Candidatus Paracaedibacter symbiosus TaxID=244582 RepID=UPI0005098324|nr:16S rRNA (guanine(966)-N(2))-methyltransferase RsmD [Candidatus Paracaedibacter symbiosus]